MKKVKLSLLVLGVLLLVISAFMHYSGQMDYVNTEEEIAERFEVGIQHPSWYANTLFTCVLFIIGFFANGLGNKVAFYIILPVFSILGLGFALIQTVTWGATPFVPHYEHGMTVQLLGCLAILSATIISLHSPKQQVQSSAPDLLDQN